MSRIAKQIKEFHERMYGETYGSGTANCTLRKNLHEEEHKELIDELDIWMLVKGENKAELAKELADNVVIAYGTAHSLGIPLDAVLDAVHRSNMSKLDDAGRPVVRADGKILKGPNYAPPDVAAVLRSNPA